MRELIDAFETDVNAYFKGADPGIDRARQYLIALARAARECLAVEDRHLFERSGESAAAILNAALAEFKHIRSQLDPHGGPRNVRSIGV